MSWIRVLRTLKVANFTLYIDVTHNCLSIGYLHTI